MKNMKIFGLFILFFTGIVHAQESQVDIFCKPILEKKCTPYSCSQVNSMEVIDLLYAKCKSSVIDLDNLKKEGVFEVNSNVGYLISYSNLLSQALIAKEHQFLNIRNNYTILNKSYDQYIEKNKKEFLSSLDFLNNESEELKKSLIEEDNINQLSIGQRKEKLNMMLESLESFKLYKKTHQELVPAIIFENNTAKFKNRKFSNYECQFLDKNFSPDEIKELKERLNYTCALS